MPEESPEKRLLLAANEVLCEVNDSLEAVCVIIVGRDQRGRVVNVPVGESGAWAFLPKPLEFRAGDTMADKLLAVLMKLDRPLKASALATRAGVKFNSHVKRTLADLVRSGDAVHLADGYWPAERPLPGAKAG